MLDDDLRRALSSGFEIRVDAATPIVGGDECLLWHVTAPRPLVVRAAPARARGFLDEYRRAGGPPYDIGMIVPFIRERLRLEVARSRAAAAVGAYHDLAYEADEIRAFAKLSGVTLA